MNNSEAATTTSLFSSLNSANADKNLRDKRALTEWVKGEVSFQFRMGESLAPVTTYLLTWGEQELPLSEPSIQLPGTESLNLKSCTEELSCL